MAETRPTNLIVYPAAQPPPAVDEVLPPPADTELLPIAEGTANDAADESWHRGVIAETAGEPDGIDSFLPGAGPGSVKEIPPTIAARADEYHVVFRKFEYGSGRSQIKWSGTDFEVRIKLLQDLEIVLVSDKVSDFGFAQIHWTILNRRQFVPEWDALRAGDSNKLVFSGRGEWAGFFLIYYKEARICTIRIDRDFNSPWAQFMRRCLDQSQVWGAELKLDPGDPALLMPRTQLLRGTTVAKLTINQMSPTRAPSAAEKKIMLDEDACLYLANERRSSHFTSLPEDSVLQGADVGISRALVKTSTHIVQQCTTDDGVWTFSLDTTMYRSSGLSVTSTAVLSHSDARANEDWVLMPIGRDRHWTFIPKSALQSKGEVPALIGTRPDGDVEKVPMRWAHRSVDLLLYPLVTFRRKGRSLEYWDDAGDFKLQFSAAVGSTSGGIIFGRAHAAVGGEIVVTDKGERIDHFPLIGYIFALKMEGQATQVMAIGNLEGVHVTSCSADGDTLVLRMPENPIPVFLNLPLKADLLERDGIDVGRVSRCIWNVGREVMLEPGVDNVRINILQPPVGRAPIAVTQLALKMVEYTVVTAADLVGEDGKIIPLQDKSLLRSFEEPGEERSAQIYLLSGRLGKIRIVYRFVVTTSNLAGRHFTSRHEMIWAEMPENVYAERYAVKDHRGDVLREVMARTASLAAVSPLEWRSDARPAPTGWISLSPASGEVAGVQVAVRLGPTGQAKLRLNENQQIYLRWTLGDPSREHEWIYLYRSGKLVPWRGQAPEGLVSIGIAKSGQLELKFEAGLVAEALRQSYPARDVDLWSIIYDRGDIPVALIVGAETIELNNPEERTIEAIQERLVAVLREHADAHRDQAGYGDVGFDFRPTLLVAEEKPEVQSVGARRDAPALTQLSTPPALSKAAFLKEKKERKRLAREAEATQTAGLASGGDENERGSDTDETVALAVVESTVEARRDAPLRDNMYRCTDEYLPPISWRGEPHAPTAIVVSTTDGNAISERISDLVEVEILASGIIQLTAMFGDDLHVYEVDPITDDVPSITRTDAAWAAERALLVTQSAARAATAELALRRAERHWIWDAERRLLHLQNGLGEAAVAVDRTPISCSAAVILGHVYLAASPANATILRECGITVFGDIWRVTGFEPLTVACEKSLCPQLIPLSPGMRVPILDVTDVTYDMAHTLAPRRAISSAQDIDPDFTGSIYLPDATALTKSLENQADATGKKSVAMGFECDGILLRCSLRRKGRGWDIDGSAPVLTKSMGQSRSVLHRDLSIESVEREPAVRRRDRDGKLVLDMRLGTYNGIPYFYNALLRRPIAEAEDFLERLLFTAAQGLREQNAVPLKPQRITPVEDAEAIRISAVYGEAPRELTMSFVQSGSDWLITDDAAGRMRVYYDERSGRQYAVLGEVMRPERIYEVIWGGGSAPLLSPLLLSEWYELRRTFKRHELLEHLQKIAAAYREEHGETARSRGSSARGRPATWHDAGIALPAEERVPFLFHVPSPDPEDVTEVPLRTVQRFRDQIFLPVPQALEDMLYGLPPIGTEKDFTFIGNRGDTLTIRMRYTWYESGQKLRTLGWLLHPRVSANDEHIGVWVNGRRLAHVEYERDGSAQIIRFGAASEQVSLRFFSWDVGGDISCFGFREGPAATKEKGTTSPGQIAYARARARLEKLLQVSGVSRGRYIVDTEDVTSPVDANGWRSGRWRLLRTQRSLRETVDIEYLITPPEAGGVIATLVETGLLQMCINGTTEEYVAHPISGTQALYLREQSPKRGHPPRRYVLALSDNGAPRLRELAPNDLDLTQAYLDEDVWGDAFLPVVKMGQFRGPLSIYNTKRIRDWVKLLFPVEDASRYHGTSGLLAWSRQHTVADPLWGGALGRLIVDDLAAYRQLHWHAGSKAIQRQAAEYFADSIKLRADNIVKDESRAPSADDGYRLGRRGASRGALDLADDLVISRSALFFPADVENDPLFEGMTPVAVFGFMAHMAIHRGVAGLTITEKGVPAARKEAWELIQKAMMAELVEWQRTHATIDAHRHRLLDAARSAHDDRDSHEAVAASGPLPDMDLDTRRWVQRYVHDMPAAQQIVILLLTSGATVPQIARDTGLPVNEVIDIIDAFENALEDCAAGI